MRRPAKLGQFGQLWAAWASLVKHLVGSGGPMHGNCPRRLRFCAIDAGVLSERVSVRLRVLSLVFLGVSLQHPPPSTEHVFPRLGENSNPERYTVLPNCVA